MDSDFWDVDYIITQILFKIKTQKNIILPEEKYDSQNYYL